MYKYICTKCGAISYSSAELKYHRKPDCEVCGGKLREAKDDEKD